MKWIFPCAIALCSSLPVSAEAEAAATEVAEVTESFDVSSVIAEPVAKSADPVVRVELGEPKLLVFSESLVAQKHVRAGFAAIHASWDFEAYRHFAKALQADPQCLMAYCGVVLSLANPQHEFNEQRAKAFNRMLSLAEHKVDGEFYYPENERMYAVGTAELMVNGVASSSKVFRALAGEYPNDLQAQLLAAFLSRGGYNELGNARMSQRSIVSLLEDLVERHPEDPMVLNFLIMVQAEAPSSAVDFKKDMLPLAEKLVELSEGTVPSWQSLLGYIAWRSGEPKIAETAFTKSIDLYKEWMAEANVGYADCEGLIRAQTFLATVLNSQGKTAEAKKLVGEANLYEFPKGREDSAGALTVKWQIKLMPLRMMLETDDLSGAKKALPEVAKSTKGKLEPYSAIIIGYSHYIDAVELVKAGKSNDARRKHARLAVFLSELQEQRPKMSVSSEFRDFVRSLNTLKVLHKELTARIAGSNGLAYNWYQTAIESQGAESRLLAPDILYPMEFRMAKHLATSADSSETKLFYEKALTMRPCYQKAQAAIDKLEKK